MDIRLYETEILLKELKESIKCENNIIGNKKPFLVSRILLCLEDLKEHVKIMNNLLTKKEETNH